MYVVHVPAGQAYRIVRSGSGWRDPSRTLVLRQPKNTGTFGFRVSDISTQGIAGQPQLTFINKDDAEDFLHSEGFAEEDFRVGRTNKDYDLVCVTVVSPEHQGTYNDECFLSISEVRKYLESKNPNQQDRSWLGLEEDEEEVSLDEYMAIKEIDPEDADPYNRIMRGYEDDDDDPEDLENGFVFDEAIEDDYEEEDDDFYFIVVTTEDRERYKLCANTEVYKDDNRVKCELDIDLSDSNPVILFSSYQDAEQMRQNYFGIDGPGKILPTDSYDLDTSDLIQLPFRIGSKREHTDFNGYVPRTFLKNLPNVPNQPNKGFSFDEDFQNNPNDELYIVVSETSDGRQYKVSANQKFYPDTNRFKAEMDINNFDYNPIILFPSYEDAKEFTDDYFNGGGRIISSKDWYGKKIDFELVKLLFRIGIGSHYKDFSGYVRKTFLDCIEKEHPELLSFLRRRIPDYLPDSKKSFRFDEKYTMDPNTPVQIVGYKDSSNINERTYLALNCIDYSKTTKRLMTAFTPANDKDSIRLFFANEREARSFINEMTRNEPDNFVGRNQITWITTDLLLSRYPEYGTKEKVECPCILRSSNVKGDIKPSGTYMFNGYIFLKDALAQRNKDFRNAIEKDYPNLFVDGFTFDE